MRNRTDETSSHLQHRSTRREASHQRSDGYVHRAEFCETQVSAAVAAKEKQADFLQNSGKAQKLKKPGAEKDELIWRA